MEKRALNESWQERDKPYSESKILERQGSQPEADV